VEVYDRSVGDGSLLRGTYLRPWCRRQTGDRGSPVNVSSQAL